MCQDRELTRGYSTEQNRTQGTYIYLVALYSPPI